MSRVSAPLLQQELMEPEPTRRLIVRPGMTAHYGVDPSTQRIAVACAHGAGHRVETHPFPRTEGFARLGDIYQSTVEFMFELRDGGWPHPGFLLVEQPSGQSPNLELVYAVGVIIAALQEAFPGVRLETMPPMSWKKLATGRGNLSKLDPETKKPWKDREKYGVMRWARENGYTGPSWDEADALGIAEAARRLVTLEER